MTADFPAASSERVIVEPMGGSASADLLYEDTFCRRVTEGKPGTVNLAKDSFRPRDLGDKSLFAKTHLSDSLAKFRASREFADTPKSASGKLAEG